MELGAMAGLCCRGSKALEENAKLCEAVVKSESNVAVMSGSGMKVSAVKEAIAVLLPGVEKSLDVRADTGKIVRSAKMDLLFIKQQ